uniref:N-acetyltransferase domain-containing protein n=1 Tax=Globodera pallida TaxID=36090 RepID=A0A183CNI2_GLOPA
MQRLSEFARTSRSDAFLWNAHSSNKGAILFYNSLGAKELTADVVPKMNCWSILPAEYKKIRSLPDIKLTVLDNVHLNEKAAVELAEDWCRLCDNASPAPHAEKKALLQAVRVGGFRVIQAQNLYGTVLGIALFHHCAFSTWNGPYITIDRLRVHAEHRRHGIGKKLVAELFNIAAELNCPKIRWTAHADASTDALFNSELADFQGLSDGPRVGADQLQRHLKNGAATALIATATKGGGQNCEKLEEVGEKEMVVGYAVYFVCPSVQFGKVFFLEDLYLRPDFRRHKFGSQMMQKLSEYARTSRSDAFLWNAHSSNKGAILFYNSLGAKELTADVVPKMNCWSILPAEYEKIVQTYKGSLPDIKLTVLDNVHLNEKAAVELAE